MEHMLWKKRDLGVALFKHSNIVKNVKDEKNSTAPRYKIKHESAVHPSHILYMATKLLQHTVESTFCHSNSVSLLQWQQSSMSV